MNNVKEMRSRRGRVFAAYFVVAIHVLVGGGHLGAAVGASADDEIDQHIRAHMGERGIPGIWLAVLRDGKLVRRSTYGVRDLEHSDPATAGDAHELASISKMFTSTAIVLLAEQGTLKLDDPLSAHLNGLPAAWRAVTVRQCLTHTSGLPDYSSSPRHAEAAKDVVPVLSTLPTDFSPGERGSYNQTGYYLLGMIIEAKSGLAYEEFLRKRLLEPLGLKSTRFRHHAKGPFPNTLAVDLLANPAGKYVRINGELKNLEVYRDAFALPAAGIYSTLDDLVRWEIGMDGGKLLKESSLNEMWANQRLNGGQPSAFGIGCWTNFPEVANHRCATSIGGDNYYIARFPEDRLTIIMLNGLGESGTGGLLTWVANKYLAGSGAGGKAGH